MSNKIEQRDSEGNFFSFNFAHHYEVWKARKDAGLPVTTSKNITDGHPLKGKTVIRKSDGKSYVIKGVYREWYGGWFIKVIMDDVNQSSAVRYWESQGCWHPDILEGITETHQEMELVGE
jgi:hypothetical protein